MTTDGVPEIQAPAIDVERLYVEHLPAVCAFAYRMLGDREAASDVAQDTFTRALTHARTFRGESAPLTWLLSIARNVCLERLRGKRRRSFARFETLVANACEPATCTQAERRIYVEQVKEGCLIGLLACLPVAQRTIFVLCLLTGLPVKEVAAITGKSENAVRILLSRARSRIRAFLCENCRLLGGARCSCENMIEFSLREGLIARYRPEMAAPQIEDEIRRFSSEVDLYRSLPDPAAAIAGLIESRRFGLFAGAQAAQR